MSDKIGKQKYTMLSYLEFEININDFWFEISNQNIQRFIDIKKRMQNMIGKSELFICEK